LIVGSMKLPISLVVIAKNEEGNIERCLRSVPFVSDIVVLDSGSHDRTVEIAKKMGARVFQQEWLGYGPQKNKAAEFAQYDWILSLDADEAISEGLTKEITEKFRNLKEDTAYRFPRKSFYLNRWILHGGWYPDYQTRLYHRKHSTWTTSQIHESITAEKYEKFTQALEHFVFRSIHHHIETNNRYSGIQAENHFQKGECFSYLRLLGKPFVKFIECYFLKLGFLDGFAGFFIAVGAAYSVFIRWGKVKELEEKKEEL